MAQRSKGDRENLDIKSKLSRKIAELTMVIHLLFTRNHEREVEIEAVKTAYEHEIGVVCEEAKGKISWLEGQLDELEKFRVLLDLKSSENDKDKQQIKELQNKEAELIKILEGKDQLLAMAEKQIVELKEQLLSKLKADDEQIALLTTELESTEKENSTLKEKLKAKTDKIKKVESQVENLQTKMKTLQEELHDALQKKQRLENSINGLESDWQDEIDNLTHRIKQYMSQQHEDQSRAEKLELKNKQLIQQVKELESDKNQLEYKIQQYIDERNKRKDMRRSPRPVPKGSPEVPRTTPAFDVGQVLGFPVVQSFLYVVSCGCLESAIYFPVKKNLCHQMTLCDWRHDNLPVSHKQHWVRQGFFLGRRGLCCRETKLQQSRQL